MNVKRDKIGIVGLGLIGASFAAALRPRFEIIGADRDAETEAFALGRGVVDSIGGIQAMRDCRAVIVCTPVSAVSDTVKEVFAVVGGGAVITDVASVKGCLIPELPEGIRYVGGHPMAGREKGGIREYSPFLMQNAIYVLTRVPSTTDADLAYVTQLALCAGAIPVYAEAGEHDRAVSKSSHLPHMLAYTLAETALSDDLAQMLAAGSIRDMTRVAASDPAFWASVAVENRGNLLADMDAFSTRFANLRAMIACGDRIGLETFFGAAREKRARLNPRVSAFRPLCVDVEDRTGVLGTVTTLLGQQGINIANIRILHSREGVGGALMLEFLTQDDYDAAKLALNDAGYRAS